MRPLSCHSSVPNESSRVTCGENADQERAEETRPESKDECGAKWCPNESQEGNVSDHRLAGLIRDFILGCLSSELNFEEKKVLIQNLKLLTYKDSTQSLAVDAESTTTAQITTA